MIRFNFIKTTNFSATKNGMQITNRKINRAIIAITIFAVSASASAELFEDGVAARNRGDFVSSLKIFEALAEEGDARAQSNLGFMYENGEGVAANNAEAFKWYLLAAQQGQSTAQFNLGVRYETGKGINQNFAEAAIWYRQAAIQGHSTAQRNLGSLYAEGRGVSRDDAEAVKWFRLAATKGNTFAQSDLGAMYGRGLGVPQDNVRAYMWFSISARKGNLMAANNRDMAKGVMTTRQIQQAKAEEENCIKRSLKDCY